MRTKMNRRNFMRTILAPVVGLTGLGSVSKVVAKDISTVSGKGMGQSIVGQIVDELKAYMANALSYQLSLDYRRHKEITKEGISDVMGYIFATMDDHFHEARVTSCTIRGWWGQVRFKGKFYLADKFICDLDDSFLFMVRGKPGDSIWVQYVEENVE